ncbi:MAG: deoxyribodipyrimidine photo-lyase, partial [Candidatus Eremiobacteraeota bacterium]|nr:deoxyribodipyrimidine photo-lyase [Candidatus Eremiobacteraeota bacterium]
MSAARRYAVSLVWLRRDLRLRDSVALHAACRRSDRVALAFVLDRALLSQTRIGAPIVHAFLCALTQLREELRRLGSDLVVLHGDFQGDIVALASRIGADAVFFNDDYEPAAVRRDDAVAAGLAAVGIAVHRSTDHVYFGADEIVRSNGNPYRIFTPYKRCWLERRALTPRAIVPSYAAVKGRLLDKASLRSWGAAIPRASALGFSSISFDVQVSECAAHRRLTQFLEQRVSRYRIDRNVPALAGTSQLSADLRAGTLGIRTCVERAFECRRRLTGEARAGVDVWISELIWRDFYQMIYKRF